MIRAGVLLSVALLAGCSTPPVAVSGEVPPPVVHVESAPAARPPAGQRLRPVDPAATEAWLNAQREETLQREEAVREHELALARANAPVQYHQRERIVYERVHREPGHTFPWNTALGATTGAIIGSTSCDTAEGALIGGSIGLFLNLCRWY